MDMLSQLIHLSYQFGPFAFALIFLFLLVRWGQKKYAEVCNRTTPPPTRGEKATYCGVFIGMAVIGVALVGVSVYWWWTHQPKYYYEGKIQEVSEVQTLDGEGFYARNVYYPQAPLRDIQFLVVQNEPFVQGQQIVLAHVRDRKLEKVRLVMTVKLGERPVYAMVYDEAKQQWNLQKQASLQEKSKTNAGLDFVISSVQAQSQRQIMPIEAPRGGDAMSPRAPLQGSIPIRDAPPGKKQSFRRDFENFSEDLQDPSTLISRKIEIVDALRSVSASELREFVSLASASNRSLKEPIFVTMTDLTRHTDREVATKAADLLRKAPLPTSYFAQALASGNSKSVSEATNLFLRLDPQYADLVLKELEKNGRVDIGPLRQVSKPGDQWKLLVPTATSAGDRYYMKIEWNFSETKITECISALPSFGIYFRGAKEAKNLAVSPRFVSDSDKFRILKMAQDVEKCGAKSVFVGYYPNTTQRQQRESSR